MTDARSETPVPYDPQLPILAELEEHVRRSALSAEAHDATARRGHEHRPPGHRAAGHGDAPTGRGRRSARRAGTGAGTTGRVLRRGAALALLGCTVGATATALNLVSDDAGPASPGVVASGPVGRASWRLQVTRREGRLCPTLSVTGPAAPGAALSTDCVAAPTGTDVVPATVLTADRAVVGGLTGPRVRAVRVVVGERRRTVPTTAVDGDEAVRAFAVVVRRPGRTAEVVPLVRPLGAGRRSVGRPVRDCSVAPRAARCAP